MCTQTTAKRILLLGLDELAIQFQVKRYALVDESELIPLSFIEIIVDRERIIWQFLIVSRELIKPAMTQVRERLREEI